ncbi:DUF4349 domain-containing protein [Hymenobacter cellulosivorans]|uniref:DUF4349 domain-containing protein n=1 Tax=Hymenobacter cellulosivorans TaxID=2932249 RepID=A0ABY4F5B6_9BACT|nr:DUF4349 domain-containing protein [Hymenobacter cellulosivorans]UOQ51243.1 DUF4349 domain-containing protein [Hymenobacter cellulosivorans]
MKLRVWSLPILLLAMACSQQSPETAKQTPPALNAMELPPPAPEAPGAPDAGETASPSVAPAATRKIIYHADVRVKVASLPQANARMDSLIRAFGAYVSDASEKREDGQWEHQMTIRVLPARFQDLLNHLNGLGALESKTLGSDDVTAEHADIAARLRTKRAVEQRYVALLSQAKKVADILEIEEKLGEVRGDIEATESRLKTLDDQVGYSTITLTYFQPIALSTPDAPVLSFGSRLVESFYSGWTLCTDLVLGLVTIWPLVVVGAAAYWGIRTWRRRRTRVLPEKA